MKKLLIATLAVFAFGTSSVSAAGASPVYDIDPYAVFDLDNQGTPFAGEYLHPEESRMSSHDYNNRVQSQVVVWGYPTASNPYPQVKIGNSYSSYVGKQAVTDNGIIVGWVMGFDHYTVSQGYLEATYYNGVYDSTAYIR